MGTLRKKCLYFNFVQVIEAADNAPVQNLPAPEARPLEEQQQAVAQRSELEIVKNLPKKRFAKSHNRAAAKKIRKNCDVPQKCNPKINNLAQLSWSEAPTRVKKSRSMPEDVKQVYKDARRLLNDVDNVIQEYFNVENTGTHADIVATSGIPIVDEKPIFQMPTSVDRRSAYYTYHTKTREFVLNLGRSMLQSEDYLNSLKKVVLSLPIYSKRNSKLRQQYNRAYLSYFLMPVHKQFKQLLRQLDLVEILVHNYDSLNKTGPAQPELKSISQEMLQKLGRN